MRYFPPPQGGSASSPEIFFNFGVSKCIFWCILWPLYEVCISAVIYNADASKLKIFQGRRYYALHRGSASSPEKKIIFGVSKVEMHPLEHSLAFLQY